MEKPFLKRRTHYSVQETAHFGTLTVRFFLGRWTFAHDSFERVIGVYFGLNYHKLCAIIMRNFRGFQVETSPVLNFKFKIEPNRHFGHK